LNLEGEHGSDDAKDTRNHGEETSRVGSHRTELEHHESEGNGEKHGQSVREVHLSVRVLGDALDLLAIVEPLDTDGGDGGVDDTEDRSDSDQFEIHSRHL